MRFLSGVWLVLGLGILIAAGFDLVEPHWRISWLVLQICGAVLAFSCAASLRVGLGARRAVAVPAAALLTLYWVYVFLISPPRAVSGYSTLGATVIILGIVTIIRAFARTGRP